MRLNILRFNYSKLRKKLCEYTQSGCQGMLRGQCRYLSKILVGISIGNANS